MDRTAYLITKVLVGWPVNWKFNGGLGWLVASPLLVTARLAPWKLGRQVPGGLGLRGTRGEAETTPRRERIRAVTLKEETIMVCKRIQRLRCVVRRRKLKG